MHTGPHSTANKIERLFVPIFQHYLNFAEHLLPFMNEIKKARTKTWTPWKLILLSEKLFQNGEAFVNLVVGFYHKNNDLLKAAAREPTIDEANAIVKKWGDVMELFKDLPQELISDMQILKSHAVDIKHPELNAGIRLGDEKIRILDEKVKAALLEMDQQPIQKQPSPKLK